MLFKIYFEMVILVQCYILFLGIVTIVHTVYIVYKNNYHSFAWGTYLWKRSYKLFSFVDCPWLRYSTKILGHYYCLYNVSCSFIFLSFFLPFSMLPSRKAAPRTPTIFFFLVKRTWLVIRQTDIYPCSSHEEFPAQVRKSSASSVTVAGCKRIGLLDKFLFWS